MTKLSVNVNKIAVVRNSRGGNQPDVVRAACDIERFGADGITVHPRPDARHIRYGDVRDLKAVLRTELNVEGNPTPSFMELVLEVAPRQVTLVPDAPDAVTSNAGWDTVRNRAFLSDICARLHERRIRVSVFVDPRPAMVAGAAACGADRVELYTEAYARDYAADREAALAPYLEAAEEARRCGSAERRPRPQSGKPALFRRADSLAGRGVDRPRAHLRRALFRIGEHRRSVPPRPGFLSDDGRCDAVTGPGEEAVATAGPRVALRLPGARGRSGGADPATGGPLRRAPSIACVSPARSGGTTLPHMLILNPDSVSESLSDPLFRRISRIAERLGVDAYVVGGYVRDHYLRRPSTDIDVVVVGSGIDVARALAAELHTQVTVYKTFGTAMLRAGGAEVEFVGPGGSPTRRIPASRRSKPARSPTTSGGGISPSTRWPGRSTEPASASWSIRSGGWTTWRTGSSAPRAIPTSPFRTTPCA